MIRVCVCGVSLSVRFLIATQLLSLDPNPHLHNHRLVMEGVKEGDESKSVGLSSVAVVGQGQLTLGDAHYQFFWREKRMIGNTFD